MKTFVNEVNEVNSLSFLFLEIQKYLNKMNILINFVCVLVPEGQMTDLVYTEKELVQSLREYIKAEESKLAAIKR